MMIGSLLWHVEKATARSATDGCNDARQPGRTDPPVLSYEASK